MHCNRSAQMLSRAIVDAKKHPDILMYVVFHTQREADLMSVKQASDLPVNIVLTGYESYNYKSTHLVIPEDHMVRFDYRTFRH